jgi:polyisoprenoid-binding protein YceI
MPERTSWTLDPVHTHVEFAVRHLMIAKVKGRFTSLEGSVSMEAERPETAQVEVRIDAASITTGNEQRDGHLRSADFLSAEQFPALSFRSRSVQPIDDSLFRMIGDLTIRDVTRAVELRVSREGVVKDPWGNQRAGFTATGKISRSDFGITWNQAIETGGVLVGDEVRITIEAELIRAALPRAA